MTSATTNLLSTASSLASRPPIDWEKRFQEVEKIEEIHKKSRALWSLSTELTDNNLPELALRAVACLRQTLPPSTSAHNMTQKTNIGNLLTLIARSAGSQNNLSVAQQAIDECPRGDTHQLAQIFTAIGLAEKNYLEDALRFANSLPSPIKEKALIKIALTLMQQNQEKKALEIVKQIPAQESTNRLLNDTIYRYIGEHRIEDAILAVSLTTKVSPKSIIGIAITLKIDRKELPEKIKELFLSIPLNERDASLYRWITKAIVHKWFAPAFEVIPLISAVQSICKAQVTLAFEMTQETDVSIQQTGASLLESMERHHRDQGLILLVQEYIKRQKIEKASLAASKIETLSNRETVEQKIQKAPRVKLGLG